MILKHVAEDSGFLEVARALLHADRFRDGDLYIVDIIRVPYRFEDEVCEPENENILNGLLAEIVIDAVNLPLVQRPAESEVESAGRFKIMSERFFQHDMTPRHPLRIFRRQPGRAETVDDVQIECGRRGEVENASECGGVPPCFMFHAFELRTDSGIKRRVRVIAGEIRDTGKKSFEFVFFAGIHRAISAW